MFNVRKILELHFVVQFSPESYIHRGSYYQNETRGAPRMINREQTHKEESILKGSPRERAGDLCMRATCNNGFLFVINDVAIGFSFFFF